MGHWQLKDNGTQHFEVVVNVFVTFRKQGKLNNFDMNVFDFFFGKIKKKFPKLLRSDLDCS